LIRPMLHNHTIDIINWRCWLVKKTLPPSYSQP
jgi:hypothetical protein